ncbi:hypothetical protein BGZ88_011547 [Linnemannia elongata]|nr:hypothetical protein BGZ88_011547 [Linnemannia elongata]
MSGSTQTAHSQPALSTNLEFQFANVIRSRLLQLPRYTDHTPTPLSDTIASYDDPSYVLPPPLQNQLGVILVQLGALTIGAVPEQTHDQVDLIDDNEDVELELEEPQQY